jgi:uncharacterized delta-60 repeat protein
MMKSARLVSFALLALLAIHMDTAALAASSWGFLDATFSEDGKVLTNVVGDDSADAVAIQDDGKIVVAGSGSGGTDIVVVRYTVGGALDTTFDGDGKVITDIEGEDAAFGIAIQPDQRILVAGASDGAANAVVVRYESDGGLDPTFGDGGVASAPVTGGGAALDIGLQTDGGIVVTGIAGFASGTPQVLVVRFDASGVPDGAFDGDGIVTTPLGAGGGIGSGLAVQADDKVVVAGASFSTSNENVALLRYATDGSLDATFGNNGKRITDVGPGPDEGHDVTLQSDGKIVVGGSANFDKAAILRYTPDGILDETFHVDGKRTIGLGGGFGGVNGIGLLADGRIVGVGTGMPSPQSFREGFAVVQLMPDGSSDPSFSDDGKAFVAFDTGFGPITTGNDVAIQADSRIVAAGTTSVRGGTSDIGVVRFGPRATRVIGRPDALVGAGGSFIGNDRYNDTAFRQTVRGRIPRGASRTFWIKVQNDGNAPDIIIVSGGFARGVSVKYFDHGVNVTRRMSFTGHAERLPAGGSTLIKAVVTVREAATVGTASTLRVGTESLNVSGKRDVVAIKVTASA